MRYTTSMHEKPASSSNRLLDSIAMFLCMAKRTPPRESLARNLAYLMDRHGLSCAALAKRSGVSAKTINNMTNSRTNVTLDNVDAVAAVFGLNMWHLIMPDLPLDMIESPTLARHVAAFCALPPAGRAHVNAVTERESVYAQTATNDKPG